jgi:hypothetical protein
MDHNIFDIWFCPSNIFPRLMIYTVKYLLPFNFDPKNDESAAVPLTALSEGKVK